MFWVNHNKYFKIPPDPKNSLIEPEKAKKQNIKKSENNKSDKTKVISLYEFTSKNFLEPTSNSKIAQ